jgi:5-(hydroxymethyl)furfural/furfural oxidase
VLSAGSTFSPPILMRSGIGPADPLRSIGIEPVVDLPVGKNLIDHASVAVRLELSDRGRCADWNERHSNVYIRYSSGMAGVGTNDMVLTSRNMNGYDAEGLKFGAMAVIIWQSFSRGEMTISSADPYAMPVIDENLLGDERDLIRLRDGAKHLFEIAESRAVQSITDDVTLAHAVVDTTGKHIRDLKNDRDIDEWMMQSVRDTWHLVGTCRMGSENDPRSVVDPECRVIGVENLRVIDGSIMPEVPRANTNLTCMTIGEHMATRMM